MMSLLLLAQVISVTAGASTLLESDGGTITLYTPNSTSAAGMGISQGHLVGSLGTHFQEKGWDVYAGDKQVFFNAGSVGLAESNRGLFLERAGPSHEVGALIGACGRIYTVPYFHGTEAGDLCVGFTLRRTIHRDFKIGSVAIRGVGRNTALGSISYHHRPLHLEATGGLLENRHFYNGLADLRFKHLGVNAARQTFLDTIRQDVTSEGIAATFGRYDLYGSAFQSRLANGQALGAGLKVAFLQLRANHFWQRGNNSLSVNATEQLTRRWSLAEYFTTPKNVNVGGSFRSNLVTASLGWQEYFVIGEGFKNLLTATASFQLPRSITLNLSLVGGRWTAYGGTFLNSGLGPPGTPLRRPTLHDWPGGAPDAQ